MAKCNQLTPLPFEGLTVSLKFPLSTWLHPSPLNWRQHGVKKHLILLQVEIWQTVDRDQLRQDLQLVLDKGIHSLAVTLLHSYMYVLLFITPHSTAADVDVVVSYFHSCLVSWSLSVCEQDYAISFQVIFVIRQILYDYGPQ